MQQKATWMHFFQPMNSKLILLKTLLIFSLFISCTCEDCGIIRFPSTATIYLINDSSVVIKSDDMLNYILQPGDTIIHIESDTIEGGKPDVNDYPLSFHSNNNTFAYDGDSSKCENGIYYIMGYENRKEVSKLNFEL